MSPKWEVTNTIVVEGNTEDEAAMHARDALGSIPARLLGAEIMDIRNPVPIETEQERVDRILSDYDTRPMPSNLTEAHDEAMIVATHLLKTHDLKNGITEYQKEVIVLSVARLARFVRDGTGACDRIEELMIDLASSSDFNLAIERIGKINAG